MCKISKILDEAFDNFVAFESGEIDKEKLFSKEEEIIKRCLAIGKKVELSNIPDPIRQYEEEHKKVAKAYGLSTIYIKVGEEAYVTVIQDLTGLKNLSREEIINFVYKFHHLPVDSPVICYT